jgi:nicotinamide riboside transporter PnuC
MFWAFLWVLFNAVYEEPAYLLWDTSIVAASVTAQSLMTIKKKESWWWWSIPVNVSSIALFVRTELWAFVFLYLIFMANSAWGWHQWAKEAVREQR